MKRSEHMLIGRFNGNRHDIFVAKRFEQALCISPIGLVPYYIRANSMRREKDDGMTKVLEHSCPVMS